MLRVACSVVARAGDATSDTQHATRNTLTLRNRQRDRRLNLPFLRRVLQHLLAGQLQSTGHDLCFHFVTAEEMARVNWQFLRHEGSTDVITFDYVAAELRRRNATRNQPVRLLTSAATPLHGEAFICVADAVKQAREFRTTWQCEVIRYAVHAVLHQRGYDDLQPAKRRVMKREENRLMRELAQRFDLSKVERESAAESRE